MLQIQSVTAFPILAIVDCVLSIVFLMQMIAFSMSSNQITQMREEFNSIDKDRSGTISMQELRTSLAAMYVK